MNKQKHLITICLCLVPLLSSKVVLASGQSDFPGEMLNELRQQVLLVESGDESCIQNINYEPKLSWRLELVIISAGKNGTAEYAQQQFNPYHIGAIRVRNDKEKNFFFVIQPIERRKKIIMFFKDGDPDCCTAGIAMHAANMEVGQTNLLYVKWSLGILPDNLFHCNQF